MIRIFSGFWVVGCLMVHTYLVLTYLLRFSYAQLTNFDQLIEIDTRKIYRICAPLKDAFE